MSLVNGTYIGSDDWIPGSDYNTLETEWYKSAFDKKDTVIGNPYVDSATGNIIKGFKFTDWEEALAMCKEAAKIVPEMAYIGWDVAFSDKGPVFVEANEFPGHDIYQLPEHTPNKIGMMPKFSNI